MLYALYSALYLVALAFLMPFEYLKRPAEARRRWIRERFGRPDPASPASSDSPSVWVHAVSVGEVIAAVPLIRKIRERHPSFEILISTVTDTGQGVAGERIGDSARIIYAPFDLPSAVGNLLKQTRPSLLIIMETELWPNTVRLANRSGIPVVLMNGRISEKSFRGYRKLGSFIRDVLGGFTLLCMQNELYAGRIRALGADPGKIRIPGNFKFDTKPPASVPGWTRILNGPVIIAGSTHRTEEDLVLDAYTDLTADFPGLNLILAPRHPERFHEVEDLVRKRGLAYIKRSEIKDGGKGGHSSLVVILDAMGELSSVYGAADAAVMGGSFIEHGGQNPLEPAYWSKAVVCGPHMENFPFIGEFYAAGAAVETDANALARSLRDLLGSPEKLARMGKAARRLYEKNSGATERAMEIVEEVLSGKPSGERSHL